MFELEADEQLNHNFLLETTVLGMFLVLVCKGPCVNKTKDYTIFYEPIGV